MVAWRWKDGTEAAAVEAALDSFVAQQAHADGVVRASWSRNAYYNDRGFAHVLVGDFVDEAAVARWVASDVHREAVAAIRGFIGEFIVVDLDEPYEHSND
jgi:quinol monooxygenase YgiN